MSSTDSVRNSARKIVHDMLFDFITYLRVSHGYTVAGGVNEHRELDDIPSDVDVHKMIDQFIAMKNYGVKK